MTHKRDRTSHITQSNPIFPEPEARIREHEIAAIAKKLDKLDAQPIELARNEINILETRLIWLLKRR